MQLSHVCFELDPKVVVEDLSEFGSIISTLPGDKRIKQLMQSQGQLLFMLVPQSGILCLFFISEILFSDCNLVRLKFNRKLFFPKKNCITCT